MIKNKIVTEAPPGLLLALERWRGIGSTRRAASLYHAVCIEPPCSGEHDAPCSEHEGLWVGVFGEGDWATYEYFVWRGDQLETSHAGYGAPEWALRDALIKVAP